MTAITAGPQPSGETGYGKRRDRLGRFSHRKTAYRLSAEIAPGASLKSSLLAILPPHKKGAPEVRLAAQIEPHWVPKMYWYPLIVWLTLNPSTCGAAEFFR